ncbi:flagellar biosynthesis anti-sigma factor FlgM [Bacillus massilinigeriensis]|uniref:flagellar biosynthesis anti-sigma factor FlgM n=1 Tax=Bacillus massilionigeriensis TaxID=1805475 RepID=UPI00096B50B7|nr:flagellar biosynthesis anti-sigma factor FlgM [Bacillus massilionigeriensis]
MKINNFGTSGINPYKRQMNKLDAANKASQKVTDKIEISSAAKEMQHVSQISVQRQARVEELKNQVQSGSYKVQTDEVASSIIDFFTK